MMIKLCFYKGFLTSVTVITLSLSNVKAAENWDKKFIDPHPQNEDFVLPMPCGGGMVFRPIEVPSEGGVLDDISFQSGQTDTQQGYSDYIRQVWLAAPFISNKSGVKLFYMAKYDVTRNQYEAVMHQDQCSAPTLSGQKAINNVSWFDAQDFSQRWSSWLLANARKSLPKRGDVYGFIRPPTETEWSYAARGGNKVSETEFLAPTWPMPEGIEYYVMAGSELANGQVQVVGSMKPNPLGLYDMLGEVGQMMQDFYHLNRVGRLQGQTGGLIVRGGNYTFNPSDLRTSLREEIPPYDLQTNQPTKLATMGFRVVIAADSLGNLQETQLAEKEFNQIITNAAQISLNTHQLIDKLRNQTTEATIKAGLDSIAAQLDSDARMRNDALTTTMRAQIEAASALAMNIWEHQHTIDILNKEINVLKMLNDQQRTTILNNIDNHKMILKGSCEGFLDLLRQIANAPKTLDKNKQFPVVITALQERGQSNLVVFVQKIQSILDQPQKEWNADFVNKQISLISLSQARGK